MINSKLHDPSSIVVIGGSDDITKPGGKVLKNLIDGDFGGKLYVVNPKLDSVQGIDSYRDAALLPRTDLAIIAIAARHCPATVSLLARDKGTRAFIILSAGFSEEGEEGAQLEREVVSIIDSVGGTLIGPNCIGFLNSNYSGLFTTPIPRLDPKGVQFISGSGATAVFIMEAAMPNGLTFSSVCSVGNSAQTGVEDILKHLDTTFDPEKDSRSILLYIESINKPDMLLRHASSLVRKGCRIAAVKAGSSEAGSRAASSHTGALATSDVAVDALLKKAGVVRCYSRTELAAVGSLFLHPLPVGRRMAIITHAGGPAVMLTDALAEAEFEVPPIEGEAAGKLLEKLHPGSSVSNPIDFLATGTAEHMGHIIDACENDFDNIDAMVVIFGSPGLFPVYDVYELLHEKMQSCKKPIYPVLPSVINVKDEIDLFLSKGRINFPDEVVFARAFGAVMNTPRPWEDEERYGVNDYYAIRECVDRASDGYLSPDEVSCLLDAAGIPRAEEKSVTSEGEALDAALGVGFPVAMKVVGPLHKSDSGGVILNVTTGSQVKDNYDHLMGIEGAVAVLVQKMHSGTELFAGAFYEPGFGHLVMAGIGGIFIEVLRDFGTMMVPVTRAEAERAVTGLRCYDLIKGVRGEEGVNQDEFIKVITALSSLLEVAPEIVEMDLNPLLGTAERVVAVDARIRIEKR